MNVHKLKVEPVRVRACPKCGFQVAQSALAGLSLDFACPACGKVKVSRYVPVRGNFDLAPAS